MKLKLIASIVILSITSVYLVDIRAQCPGSLPSINSTKRLPEPVTGDCIYDVVATLGSPRGISSDPFEYTFNYNGAGTAVPTSVVISSSSNAPIMATFEVTAPCNSMDLASVSIIGQSTTSSPPVIDFCGNITTVLPVEISLFEAAPLQNGEKVQLYWRTNSELDNEGFEIERSKDAKNWQMLDFINGNGTSGEIHEYEWKDDEPLELGYYRLKQYDYSGAFEYSSIVSAQKTQAKETKLEAYPNPTTGLLNYELKDVVLEDAYLQLFDQFGRLARQWQADNTPVFIDDMPSGIYMLSLQNGRKQYHQRIIKR